MADHGLHILSDARELFAMLAKEGGIQLVAIIPDGTAAGHHFGDNVEAALLWAASQNEQGHGIYWTSNIVADGLHKKPAKAEIAAARLVHVDVDPPKDGTPWDKRAAYDEIMAQPLAPTLVIDSGNGLQAVWMMAAPTDRNDIVEGVNRCIETRLNADSCHNIDRLLRVPGFVNFPNKKKREAGRMPVLAGWGKHDDGVRYTLEDLQTAFPPMSGAELDAHRKQRNEPNQGSAPQASVSSPWACLTADQQMKLHSIVLSPSGRDRSGDLLAFARQAIEAGVADDVITAIGTDARYAISAHARDQADPVRAVKRAIEKVRATPDYGNEPGLSRDCAGGMRLDHFRAYMPTHSYIFAPTGELWPASSVNSRLDPVPLVSHDGEPMFKKDGRLTVQRASAWLDENRAVEQMTWAPGLPQVIENKLVSDGGWRDEPGFNVFNLYRPPLLIEGDPAKAQPWIEHVRRVYRDEADHLIRWFAQRVQRPHEKINHAIVLGGAQGIGKDTILEPVKAAIGPWNFTEVSPHDMLSRFNGYRKSVILRVSEMRDLGDSNRFDFYETMKILTAAPPDVLRVDEKHMREYAVFNVCGVIFTTNHKTDGIFLPADDRRHYVAWSPLTREAFDDDYWSRLYGWYESGGLGHVAAYLRELDITDFNAKAEPPKTPAFWDIVSANATPEDAELTDALEKLGQPEATTIATIASVADYDFREFLTDRRNSRRIPHRLEQCGYAAVRNDAAKDGLFKISGKRCTVYARVDLSPKEQHAAAQRLIGRSSQ